MNRLLDSIFIEIVFFGDFEVKSKGIEEILDLILVKTYY